MKCFNSVFSGPFKKLESFCVSLFSVITPPSFRGAFSCVKRSFFFDMLNAFDARLQAAGICMLRPEYERYVVNMVQR